jgi:hypothetical protein
MSAALSQGMLDAMRTVSETSLPRTCTIPGARTVTNSGDGTWEESTAEGTADVKCSFMAAAGNERLVGGAIAQIGNYVLTFETGVTLTPGMAVAFDATDEEAARTFQLVAPLDEPQQILQRWLATEG